MSNIKEVDAILHMVRVFEDNSVIHVNNKVDPMKDIGVINLELVLSDFEIVSKRIGTLAREVKRGDKEAVLENNILEKVYKVLEEGKMATEANLTDDEKFKIKSLNLLTLKPMLYALNHSKQIQT